MCGDIVKKSVLILTLVITVLFIGVSVEAKELGLNILASSSTSCSGYFGSASEDGTLMNILVKIFRFIQISVPIILLVFTTLDFSKVVFGDSKDGMEKAKKNFGKRALIAVFIFFIPTLLEILLTYVNNEAINSCLNNLK